MTEDGPDPRPNRPPETEDGRSLLALLDELRVIAQNGLEYGDDGHDAHDEERYRRLLDLTSEWYGVALDLPPAAVRDRLAAELGHATAKVGANAAVFDDDGRILLVRRADNGRWDLPGGFVEPNETPPEAAVREAREEAGVEVSVAELVGVYSVGPDDEGSPHAHTHVPIVYRCERIGGELDGSHESAAVRFRHVDDVSAWHTKNEQFARDAHERWVRRDE